MQRHTSASFLALAVLAVLGLGGSTAAGEQVPVFGPATNYDASYNTRSADVGDFNGDGRPDVVCATALGVGVRLNNGASLADEVLYLHQGVGTTVVGDLDGDGNLDVVATTATSTIDGHVRVLLGNGDGTFTVTAEIYDFGDARASEAVLGDLDSDGDLDLALSNLDSNVSVFLGNGDGTFSARQAVDVWETRDVDLADLNGDGKLDLAAGSAWSNDVRVLLGNGDGTFQIAQTVASFTVDGQSVESTYLAVDDLNGDGTLDLAVTYNSWYVADESTGAIGYLGVLLGNGDGTFALRSIYWIGPGFIQRDVLADFTGDGKPDIVAGGGFGRGVALLVGSGDGTFHAPEFPGGVHGSPYDIGVADLDGNGALDIVTADPGSNTLSVLLNGANPLPALSISDVTKPEGRNRTTTLFTFTVTLSPACAQPVTMSYRTVNDTATTGNSDYVAKSGTLTFAPGATTATIAIEVKGDNKREANEIFYVDLFGLSTNAKFTKNRGVGTILSDE